MVLSLQRSIVPRNSIQGDNMRVIIPLIFGLFGALIGIAVCRVFVRSWLAYPAAALIGALSAFAGLIVRDVFDATLVSSDPLIDSLFAALLMSLAVSIIANVVTSLITRREKPD